ncbi:MULTISPECIES: class-II fumarase/aspartase family protein [Pseudonocardia]|uniref:Adenylosuccinate lyase n=2 Tax=Pseudonocardia TaxID=1847 RepID=A0A1Y2N991_PSEAH|nr:MULTISPECIES: adenylosuccinate lyase family protein [Pseudonocardia]OSY43478.1 Adenylosuccinate lyase [Pseudonocardia autotrophica]TDN73528.1 3-carboxy-cis,cis-muconate cycloisomerase [Pseudonocardia autotrophica]BBG04271.1 adenylosuccinate lyase [Pseudonocardia autotrophica]GEC25586.1 adenylosuccinate lyase [Pseudonocardia saturnea]
MVARLTESPVYAHLWSTPELDRLLGERARWQAWLDVLVVLARVQARAGIVPVRSAEVIAERARVELLDWDLITEQTRRTSHSTLGLIRGLRAVLPPEAREDVYVGATVQDLTDTWFGLLMRDVGDLAVRDVTAVRDTTLRLAHEYRNTPMAGRTHAQPGAPITFGLKAASWADELGRHLDRLREGRDRWAVGQLAGAVGALAFHDVAGGDPLALRAAFCAELGLGDPGISWLTSRDRVAEFGWVLAAVCATTARIGGEVVALQRPEIGELAEPTRPEAVGSITMPHKRNPELGEHLDTLARLARAASGVLLEGTVALHERDGRGWKAEWAALPEVCLLTGTALGLARELVDGLEVYPEAMRDNLARHGDRLASERILGMLSLRLGKHAAQELLHEVLAPTTPGEEAAVDLATAVAARGVATAEEVREWSARPATRAATAMVDIVLQRAGWES